MTRLLKKAFLMLLLTSLPSLAAAERIDGIAAVVNGELITTYELDKEAASIVKNADKRPGPTLEKAEIRAAALNQLIDKKLVAQKIKELDIKVSDEEVRQAIDDVKKQNNLSPEALVAALNAQGLSFDQYKTQIREQMEHLRLMSQEVRSKIQVGEKEMQEYYEANYKSYSEEMFQARHIFFSIGQKAPESDVKRITATAASVLQEIRNGKDFAELAKKYSDDASTAKDGGDLGTFRKGEMLPDIEQVLERMKPGEVSDLVKTAAGLHIIKLEKRFVKSTKTFDDAKGEIEETLYKKKSEERFRQWSADLKKNAVIDIRQ
ncbi:MAG TPA: peptidylprolyl isomerase [Geobacteraceae bacterium]|nr:peptidylprolyl isomerase [Geobacteraceae bacterium]